MAIYDKKAQIDLYQKRKEKSNWGAWLFWGLVALIIIGTLS